MQLGSTVVPMESNVTHEVAFTELEKYIMSFPPKTKLVRIHDAWLTREDLQCFLQDGGWLDGDVS